MNLGTAGCPTFIGRAQVENEPVSITLRKVAGMYIVELAVSETRLAVTVAQAPPPGVGPDLNTGQSRQQSF